MAEELYERAKVQIEQHENWQLSGALILEALKQERKAGIQVLNLIKVRPKTKLEFRSQLALSTGEEIRRLRWTAEESQNTAKLGCQVRHLGKQNIQLT